MPALELSFDYKNQRYRDAETGLRALGDALGKQWDGQAKVLSAELRDFLGTIILAMQQRHGKPWPTGTTFNTLSKRSGALIAGMSFEVTGEALADIAGSLKIPFPGQVHEFGATIKVKKAQFLTIPLPAALNANGTPKKKSAREWKNTFVAKSKAGNLIIFQRQGAKIVPLYVLKKQVKIPERLGLRDTVRVGVPYFVDRVVDAMVRDMTKAMA